MQESVSLVNLLYTVLFVFALVFPLYRATMRELESRNNPQYYKKYGVIVKTLNALDAMHDVIGRYMDANIYGEIVFKGIRYHYDRVAPASYKRLIQQNQLFLEPGLVYVAAD